MHAIERPIPVPQIEIAIHCRSRRHVFRYRAPLAARRQNIQESVYDLAYVDRALVAPSLGRERPIVMRISENDERGASWRGQYRRFRDALRRFHQPPGHLAANGKVRACQWLPLATILPPRAGHPVYAGLIKSIICSICVSVSSK